MSDKSMTALMSAFARAYHSKNKEVKIFDDYIAYNLIGDETYNQIANELSEGISYFDPDFIGTKEEGLEWIVDNQLSPTTLSRSRFAENAVNSMISTPNLQYILIAAGYDSYAFRESSLKKNLQIFELDQPGVIKDKLSRIQCAKLQIPENLQFIEVDLTKEDWISTIAHCEKFHSDHISVCNMMGLSYYLQVKDFQSIIHQLSSIMAKGSLLLFDYPEESKPSLEKGDRVNKQLELTKAAGESMVSEYSKESIVSFLENEHFTIKQHLSNKKIEEKYFKEYNDYYIGNPTTPFKNINFIIAEKR